MSDVDELASSFKRDSTRLTLQQSGNSNNDFDCIAKGRVKQAGERVPELQRHLLRGCTQ